MGLKLETQFGNTGITVGYWRIYNKQDNIDDKAYTLTLKGYTSKADRDAGKDNVDARIITLSLGEDYEADLTREDLYKLIKGQPGWEKATDIK